MRPSEMEPFVRELASALGALGGGGAPPEGASAAPSASPHASFITALAKDLQQFRGASIVIPGDEQSPMVHALAHAINAALGNVGNSLVYTDPVEANAVNQMQSLAELVQDMNSGSVKLLMILGGNPVYNAPADLGFVEALKKVQLRAHLSMHKDETSEWCQWQIPEAHFLEAWSDARAFDGTVSIMQPLIEPLYGGKSAHEVMALLINQTRKGYEIVRDYWQSQMGGNFEQAWRRAVHNGIVPDTALQPKTVALRGDFAAQAAAQSVPTPNSSMEILFRQDPTVYDGRFANNGWLQELPKPLSKLTWDNAAYISERTARDLGLEQKIGTTGGNYFVDTVNLTYRGARFQFADLDYARPADNTVTMHLGYGRARRRVGDNLGFNAYALRTSDAPWQGTGVEMRKTGEQYELAATQLRFNLLSEEAENRHIVRAATFEEYKKNPRFAQEAVEEPGHDVSMYEPWDYSKGYAWGMTIDVNTCVGCSACVVACQAENNIPVVGKGQVLRSREMHWLRVDNYFKGAVTNPQTYFMPVPCMHCELAPCEVVCPVNATVHSAEGLNDMVYNRCVGTRYC
ncbi:MAG: 4Fe-4S dicluster domain-containing protein, partial [Pyrinomonadaceae bacterium]